MTTTTAKCQQCDSMTINGVYVHEAGCPNEQRPELLCDYCGYDVAKWFNGDARVCDGCLEDAEYDLS